MAKVTIEFSTAFKSFIDDDAEERRIMEQAFQRVRSRMCFNDETYELKDSNGEVVGSILIQEDESKPELYEYIKQLEEKEYEEGKTSTPKSS